MSDQKTQQIRYRLIDAGGRVSQDLGLGRIAGQTLVYLYLSREACSLDNISSELQLSKASASIAARQLERLGMIIRVWKGGDRKSYYQTADNFVEALQKGVVGYMFQKLQMVGSEIEKADEMLGSIRGLDDPDTAFLVKRVNRAKQLKGKAETLLNNPIVKFLTSRKDS